MNVMFFIVPSNTFDSNQNIKFMIQQDFLFLYELVPQLPIQILVSKCNYFSKVEVHSTRLEIELALNKIVTCEYDVFTNTMLLSYGSIQTCDCISAKASSLNNVAMLYGCTQSPSISQASRCCGDYPTRESFSLLVAATVLMSIQVHLQMLFCSHGPHS